MTGFVQRPRGGASRSAVSSSTGSHTTAFGGRQSTVSQRPRSAAYLAAVGRLDGRATLRPADLEEICDAIRHEFEQAWAAQPIGLVSHCYLGYPYEAHVLDVAGAIVEHYKAGQALPSELQRARPHAMTETYALVEVYSTKVVCVRMDGTTITVEGE